MSTLILSEPDPRRAEHRWIVASLLFGLPTGPLLSAVVNHGHPRPDGLLAVIPVLALYAAFASRMLDVDPRSAVAERAAAVLLGGSVLFMLPRFLALPATGAPWQPSCAIRFLICCAPYPLLGWLAAPVKDRAVTVGVWSGLAATVLAWPLLTVGMRQVAAQQIRHQIAAPAQMLLAVDTPADRPASGYMRSGNVVWMSFNPGVENSSLNWNWYEGPDDLDMYVFPLGAASPCALVGPVLENTVGLEEAHSSCTRTGANLWVAKNMPENGAVTDIEEYRGLYVALSVDSGSASPIPPSALTGLFATLHPADDSELAATGIMACLFWTCS